MRQAVESAREAWGLATMCGFAGKGETLDIVPRFLWKRRTPSAASSSATEAATPPVHAARDACSLMRNSVRLPTRTGLVLAVAAFVVALPTAAGALPTGKSSPAAAVANTQTFTDSTGEDPAAPDITTIVVSNDDAGTITFRFNVPNRPQYARDIALIMFLDSDANQATGDAESLGADHVIQLIGGEILLFKWDGTDYSLSATQSSLSYTWQSGAIVRINASDLNNTRRLNFDALVLSGIVFDETTGAIDCTACVRDFAPTVGFFSYPVLLARPTLVVRSVTRTPARPTAGRTFTLRMVTARSDTGAALQNGRVTCVGRVGTARLRAVVARVQGGAVVCTWPIPPKAKGKAFRGSVAVVFEGLRASRSYSSRIR